MWRVPKIYPRFGGLLGLTEHSIHSHSRMDKTYYTKRIQSNSAEGKGTWGHVQRKPGLNVQESPPGGVTWDTLNSSSNELRQHVGNVCLGSSLETQCQSFYWGLLTRHPLTGAKVPEAQRKADVRREPRCLHKQFRLRYNEPLLSIRKW